MSHSCVEHILLSAVSVLLEGNRCIPVGLLKFTITAITLVSKDICYFGRMPDRFSGLCLDALVTELSGDFRYGMSTQVLSKYLSDDGSLQFMGNQGFINQTKSVWSVVVYIFTVLHALHNG